MEAFDNTVRDYTTWLDNPYVSGALTVFLIVYASMAAPKLPHYIANLFDYTLFKILMFFLIVYISKKNATVALVAAVALMVSIMTLDRLKVGAEMMAVVKNEEGSRKNCRLVCDDDDEIDENVAKTTEGKMVVVEAKKAVALGVLHPTVAAAIVKKVVTNEAVGKPVLATTTQEGAQRMAEVAKAQNAGTLSPADAKQVAAKIVVHEAVMKAKVEEQPHHEEMKHANPEAVQINPSVVKTPEAKAIVAEVNKAVASGAMHPTVAVAVVKKIAATEAVGKPVLVATTPEGAQRMAEIAKAHKSGALSEQDAKQIAAKVVVHEAIVQSKVEEHDNRVEEHPSVAKLAEEVMRRKQEETARRGGVQPSGDELREICAGVMDDYRQSGSCGLDCTRPSLSASSDISGNDVSDNDESASSYASVDHN